MFYFSTRDKARNFAKKNDGYQFVDMKDNPSLQGHRWAVKVF